jgi:serpin B
VTHHVSMHMTNTIDRITDTVLRTAARHRRRRALGSAAAALAVVAVVVSFVLSSSSPTHRVAAPTAQPGLRIGARLDGATELVSATTPVPARGRAALTNVVAGQQALALALLQRLGGHGNVSVSPTSLDLALAMLQNGARGRTEKQIAHALQTGDLTTTQQNAGLAQLTLELATAARDSGVTLQSANSLWQQSGFPLRRPFMAALATYYRTGVWQTDFTTSAGANAINAWTKQATHGKITKLFDQLSADTVLVLANAVYFHAAWATPFDAQLTMPSDFTTGSGRHVQAQYMSGGAGLTATTTADYSAAQLPYRGGRFAALAIMPTHGSLADFTAHLTPAELGTIAGSVTGTGRQIELPRFTTTSTTNLEPVLQSLGMTDAFGAADFSGLSAQPTSVDQVVQRVYLSVGEKGTTAAAVTGVAMASGAVAGPPPIAFDHPFLFLVRDTRTGAILFASAIDDPTISG